MQYPSVDLDSRTTCDTGPVLGGYHGGFNVFNSVNTSRNLILGIFGLEQI